MCLLKPILIKKKNYFKIVYVAYITFTMYFFAFLRNSYRLNYNCQQIVQQTMTINTNFTIIKYSL